MSFPRHGEIYPSDGGSTLAGRTPAHRLDEFPTGYSLAGCSPAEPASASPAVLSLLRLLSFAKEVSANGDLSLISVSHPRGAAQMHMRTIRTFLACLALQGAAGLLVGQQPAAGLECVADMPVRVYRGVLWAARRTGKAQRTLHRCRRRDRFGRRA